MQENLFGEEVYSTNSLREKWIEPPFSVLNTTTDFWQSRRKKWFNLGLKGELGRQENITYVGAKSNNDFLGKKMNEGFKSNTSIFDPLLCEIMYHWFSKEKDLILDPFAGGIVRGFVATEMNRNYIGIDIRKEQIDSNKLEIDKLCKENKIKPNYILGDADNALSNLNPTDPLRKIDFVFSCPPYVDLEVYSDLKEDLSTMDYDSFLIKYKSIIKKSCQILKEDGYACFVVVEVRDKKGFYYNFVGDTIKSFLDSGMKFYNDIILLNSTGTAAFRANGQFKNNRKVVKIHQNILVFKKA